MPQPETGADPEVGTVTFTCPRCGRDIPPGEEYASPKTGASLCLQCYKEECVIFGRELVGYTIPAAMQAQIDEIISDPCLGFNDAFEFVMESLRQNIRYYLSSARGR